jgi:hypothetical protein
MPDILSVTSIHLEQASSHGLHTPVSVSQLVHGHDIGEQPPIVKSHSVHGGHGSHSQDSVFKTRG